MWGVENFVRRQSLDKRELEYVEREIPPTGMTVLLATCASVTVMKRVVGITYTLKGVQYNDDFIILDLDDKCSSLDCCCSEVTSHKSAGIDEQSICLSLVSSDGHLINAMGRPLTCGCTTSECDGLPCGCVVSTTAYGHEVSDRHTMKPDSGDCIEMQVAPNAHHPNKASGLGHECPPNRQHPSDNEPIANDWQYDDLSAIWRIARRRPGRGSPTTAGR